VKSDFETDTKKYLSSNGTTVYYADVVDQLLVLLEEQYPSLSKNDDVLKMLKEEKNSALLNLENQLVEAYRGHFTQADIIHMNTFYASASGKRMVKDMNSLNEEDIANLNAFNESETGAKIAESRESLSAVMGQITEKWSGDLYQSMTAILAENGLLMITQ
jgi:hypothetical protein